MTVTLYPKIHSVILALNNARCQVKAASTAVLLGKLCISRRAAIPRFARWSYFLLGQPRHVGKLCTYQFVPLRS